MEARITPEELKAKMQVEVDRLVSRMCEAINGAALGRIVAESEEPVRDAHAEFRESAFQAAIDLLGEKLAQEAFSPSGPPAGAAVAAQGPADDASPDGKRVAGDPPGGVLEPDGRERGAGGRASGD